MAAIKPKPYYDILQGAIFQIRHKYYNWMDDAACAGMPIDTFFIPPGDRREAEKARVICRTCPVLLECKEFAIENRIVGGIYGGLTTAERRCIIRERTRGKGKL